MLNRFVHHVTSGLSMVKYSNDCITVYRNTLLLVGAHRAHFKNCVLNKFSPYKNKGILWYKFHIVLLDIYQIPYIIPRYIPNFIYYCYIYIYIYQIPYSIARYIPNSIYYCQIYTKFHILLLDIYQIPYSIARYIPNSIHYCQIYIPNSIQYCQIYTKFHILLLDIYQISYSIARYIRNFRKKALSHVQCRRPFEF